MSRGSSVLFFREINHQHEKVTMRFIRLVKPGSCRSLVLLAGILLAAPAFAAKPAFNCAKADGEVEELICSNDELAALDHKIADVYKAAMKNLPADEQKTEKAYQRGWIKGRNDCWKADDIEDCVRFSYESRITELQIKSGQMEVPEPVYYQCGDTHALEDTVIAVFYKDSQLPAAVLTKGDEQVIALRSPSASGAKYEVQNVTFWEKSGEAQVSWNGEELTCNEK
jgi:uncharacterized protein